MSQTTTQYAADGASGLQAVRRLFTGVTRTWPNDCPDCGERMEFIFEPQTARVCPACGTRITQNAVTGAFVQDGRRPLAA